MSQKNIFLNFFLIATILLIHFDPIGLKITIPFLFLIFLAFYFNFSSQTFLLLSFSSFFSIIIFFNLLNTVNLNYINFFKTFILLLFSFFYHTYFATCSNLHKFKFDVSILNISLSIILLISLLQFLFFEFFNISIFFNLFGKYTYTNEYDLELLYSGPTRVTAFYLEPSYLAFVVIHIYLFIFMLNKFNIFNFLSILVLLILSGSRGGFIFFLLFLIHLILFSNLFDLKKKTFILFFILFFFSFVFFTSDSFLILTPDSLSTENTSQFERVFLGFKFSELVLKNYPTGIALGQIENYFTIFFGIKGTLYSFFYLLIAYFGYFGLLILLIFYFFIFFKFSFRLFTFLFIYSLMYFNLSGSLLAPDTYFWFVIFVILFRKSVYEKNV
jgi:hypothetical protein